MKRKKKDHNIPLQDQLRDFILPAAAFENNNPLATNMPYQGFIHINQGNTPLDSKESSVINVRGNSIMPDGQYRIIEDYYTNNGYNHHMVFEPLPASIK